MRTLRKDNKYCANEPRPNARSHGAPFDSAIGDQIGYSVHSRSLQRTVLAVGLFAAHGPSVLPVGASRSYQAAAGPERNPGLGFKRSCPGHRARKCVQRLGALCAGASGTQ
jgi:hypothetical protein